MLDDLFAADNLKAAQDLARRPPPAKREESKFSAWKLTTAAPRGVAAGAAQSGGFFADVLGAFGQVDGATYTGDLFGNMTDQQRQQTDQAAQKLRTEGMDFSSEGGDLLRGVAKGYSPDPESAHAAERLVFDFARFASKAVGYTAAGGPVIGAALTAADEGMAAADELKQQGVDLATRTKAGAVIGAVSGLSVALPMAGRTMAETAALVATGGPLSFMGQQQAVRSILQAADYSKLAEQYDPFDPVGLAVSTLVPAAFGVHGLRVNRAAAAAKAAEDFRTGPVPSAETPTAAAARETMAGRPADEHVDAARTLLMVDERQRSNPGRADDMSAVQAHETALAKAEEQIAAGERVSVADVAPTDSIYRGSFTKADAMVGTGDPGPGFVNAELTDRVGFVGKDGRQYTLVFNPDGHSISALDGSGKKVGELDPAPLQGYEIKEGVQSQAAWMGVDEAHRRNGLNTAMNRLASEKVPGFKWESNTFTGDGRAWFEASKQHEGGHPFTDWQTSVNAAIADMRAEVEAQRNATPAPARETPAAPAKPQAADAAGPGRPAAPAPADQGPGTRPAAGEGGLVDDGAAARVAQIQADMPDLMVQLDGMDAPMRLADVLAAVKAEADDMKLDGDLMQAAAECALLNGR